MQTHKSQQLPPIVHPCRARSGKPPWPGTIGALAVVATLTLTGCSVLDVLNTAAPVSSTLAESGIAYGPRERQRLDVYRPAGTADGNAPVVVFFYGGRWSDGDRADYAFVGAALAEEGMVVVIPDYRLYPQVRFPAFVEDGARAVEWTHGNMERFGGDPESIYLLGHSAGAHIASLLALDPRYLDDGVQPAGMIGLAGPYDFLPLEAADLRTIFGPPERFSESQPIEYARGDAPPLYLLHGLEDETVRPGNSRNLAQAIRERGGRVETRFYESTGHAEIIGAIAGVTDFLAPVRADIVDFVHGRTRNDADADSSPAHPEE